jgi:hypothetical protein
MKYNPSEFKIGKPSTMGTKGEKVRDAPAGAYDGLMGKDRLHAGDGDRAGVLSNDLHMEDAAEGTDRAPADLAASMDKTNLFPVRQDNVRLGHDAGRSHDW